MPAGRHATSRGSAAAPGGTRDIVLPGNKKFIEGDILPRPSGRRRQGASGAGRRRRRGRVPLRPDAATNSSICSSTTSNCPISPSASWPRRRARASAAPAIRRPARRPTSRCSRTVRRAMARRIALRRPKPEEIAALRGGARRRARDEARRVELLAEIEALEGQGRARSRSSIRSTSATAASSHGRSRSRRR